MTQIEQQRTLTATLVREDSSHSSRVGASPETLGPFQVTGTLGQGGMGSVYSAIDTRNGAHVALKTLPLGLDDLRLRALKREFRLMSEFWHLNVVEMYDLRAENGTWYVVMERIHGTDFVAWCRQVGWGDGRALQALRQLVEGLIGLHDAGWIHRDIKGSNVLVEAETNRTVLLDFGLAEALGTGATHERKVLGTRSHMAPELVLGAHASPASDWYAVGVMLCACVLGASPPAEGRLDVLLREARLREGTERLVLELAADLLHPQPDRRPTGSQVATRLQFEPKSRDRTVEPLEGRQRELAQLSEALAGVREGKHTCVVVHGAAGFGKTSLVEHFLDDVEKREGAFVFRSRCRVNEHIPFKAVDRLVEGLVLAAVSGAEPSAPSTADRDLPRICELFPALANLPGVAPPSPRDDNVPPAQRRVEAFLELRQLVAELRARCAIVVFVDDAHHGDADSASLLHAVMNDDGENKGHGILLIWTQRPAQEHTPFLLEVARTPIFRGASFRIEVLPLDVTTASRMARSFLPSATDLELQEFVQGVNGSPLLLSKARRSRARHAEGGVGDLLRAMVDADLEATTISTRRLLSIVAIAATAISMDVAFRAAGSESDAYHVLSTLRQAGLVTINADTSLFQDQDCLELYHEEFRELLVDRISGDERGKLHLDLARALEASGRGAPGLISVHLHAGGEIAAATRYALEAAEKAEAALAFASAAEHLQRALVWGNHEAEGRRRLQARLAGALFNTGDCVGAAKTYDLARQGASATVGRELAVRQASSWFSAGHLEEGIASIAPALSALGIKLPRPALLMPTIAAKVLKLRWRGLDLLSSSTEADPDGIFRADACWSIGSGLSIFLSMQGSYFIVQSLIESLPLGDGHRIGRGLAFVGGVCANMPGFQVWGEQCLTKAEELAIAHDDAYLQGWSKVWRANAELVGGRLVDATDLAEQAIELIERGPYAMTWECHTARCFALMARERRGELLEVERQAELVLRNAALQDDLYGRVVFSLFAAQVAVAKGELGHARTLARDAMARWTQGSFTIQHFYALRVEAYCDLSEGKLDSARARVVDKWQTIQGSDVSIVLSAKVESQLLRAQVELALASASTTERTARLKSVARLSKALEGSCPEGRGFAHLLRSCASMVRGDPSNAQHEARLAAETFDQLGMPIWSAAAHRSLAIACGERSRGEEQEQRLSVLGVRMPGRWLAVMTPGFA